MKKAAALALAVQLIASSFIYPSTMVVTKCGSKSYKIQTATGYTYTVKERPEDLEVGDLVSVIMFTKGTKNIKDDTPLMVYYSGFWMDGGKNCKGG